MLSADLKYNIKIEVRTESKSAQGAATETWDLLGERRASVKHFAGGKDYETETNDIIHSFSISFMFRYISGLNYKCRIILDDQVYQIQDIQLLRRREGYKVLAERRGTNA